MVNGSNVLRPAPAAIAPPVAHLNRIRRLEGDRPACRDGWYHRPLRVKRLIAVARARKQVENAA